jgi:hypothetical protein
LPSSAGWAILFVSMGLYLVPATSENLKTSIDHEPPVDKLSRFLSAADMKEIRARGGADGIRCWAMTVGKRRAFEQMEPGDEVLFAETSTGRFTRYAQVTYKVENRALGEELWSFQGGNPWEFIYFLRNVRRIDRPKREVVVALTYEPTFEVAGATRVREDRLSHFTGQHGTMATWLGLSLINDERRTAPKPTYGDFGQAPDDDVNELQMFALKVRRGQSRFRKNLLRHFKGKCPITATDVEAVLEAAHINPHSASGLNHTDNGLLLRADIHALFDDDLICIDPETLYVVVSPSLKGTIYWDLNGHQVFRRSEVTEQRFALLRARWARRRT